MTSNRCIPCLPDPDATQASEFPIPPHSVATHFFGAHCRHVRTHGPASFPKASTSLDPDGLDRGSELEPAQFVPLTGCVTEIIASERKEHVVVLL